MNKQAAQRLAAKTAEQRFLNVLEQDFAQPPPVAQVLLDEAQSYLFGQGERLRPGQMRVILAQLDAGYGQALRRTATAEVTWTVDAGQEERLGETPAPISRIRLPTTWSASRSSR